MNNDWEYKEPVRFDLKTDKETHDARVQQCNDCEKLTKFLFCESCMCFMPLKTWLKVSKCPLNKW